MAFNIFFNFSTSFKLIFNYCFRMWNNIADYYLFSHSCIIRVKIVERPAFMIDPSLLSDTYMYVYIPIYLHDIPRGTLSRYSATRTTAKLTPGLLRLGAFLRKLQLPKLDPSLVPSSTSAPALSFPPLCSALFGSVLARERRDRNTRFSF